VTIRFQADNDLRHHIVRAVRHREPAIDFRSAHSAGLDAMSDYDVLQYAAREGRIQVSHDKRTIPEALAALLTAGVEIPGLFLVIPQDASIQRVVESIVLVWAASEPEEWRNQITRIPF